MTRNILTKIIKDESGATAIEYGLILAIMAAAIIGAFGLLRDQLTALFGVVGDNLTLQQ
jgi:pilus assembly protein Flp/PilA